MNQKRHLLLLALMIALLAIPTFVVFAKELGSLTITGPGIDGRLSLGDPKDMMGLEEAGFFDQAALKAPPKDLNMKAGYAISASLNLDGKMVPFVEMMYFPTEEGKPGYVHYSGRLQGESMQPADDWAMLNVSADTAFRELMAANNVTLQSALVAATVKSEVPAEAPAAAEPAVVAVASKSPMQSPSASIILAITVTALLLVGAGLAIKRRTMSTSS
jgi:hypothetical protein